jgi:methyl-accepting chemotaxis protein
MSQNPSLAPPAMTRQRGASSGATNKKTQKELENAEGLTTDVRSKEQAVAFLQAREYLVPGKPIDLHTLAHILLQFGNAAARVPKVITDGIRAVAFLMTEASAQQMAEEITDIVKIQIQEHMESLTTNTETIVREAIEGVTYMTQKIADQMDDFKEELRETADRLAGSTQELLQTTQELVEKTGERTNTTQNTTERHTQPETYAAAVQHRDQVPIAHATVM